MKKYLPVIVILTIGVILFIIAALDKENNVFNQEPIIFNQDIFSFLQISSVIGRCIRLTNTGTLQLRLKIMVFSSFQITPCLSFF